MRRLATNGDFAKPVTIAKSIRSPSLPPVMGAKKTMKMDLQPICTPEAECKCCGAAAARYGVVDFHKNCELYRANPLGISGIPIYYHRCPECGFIFTTAFDHFTNEDFERYIYNNEYPLIDPDYREARPKANAGLVSNLFQVKRPACVLDYGGGSGVLAETLRTVGFAHVDTYDPFVPQFRASRQSAMIALFASRWSSMRPIPRACSRT